MPKNAYIYESFCSLGQPCCRCSQVILMPLRSSWKIFVWRAIWPFPFPSNQKRIKTPLPLHVNTWKGGVGLRGRNWALESPWKLPRTALATAKQWTPLTFYFRIFKSLYYTGYNGLFCVCVCLLAKPYSSGSQPAARHESKCGPPCWMLVYLCAEHN